MFSFNRQPKTADEMYEEKYKAFAKKIKPRVEAELRAGGYKTKYFEGATGLSEMTEDITRSLCAQTDGNADAVDEKLLLAVVDDRTDAVGTPAINGGYTAPEHR